MQVTTQPFHAMPSTNSLLFILRCVTHTLTDESRFRQRSPSLLPQDACRTSWQVICDRPNFNVSDKNNANLWQTANSIQIQLPMHAQPFTRLQNRSQWFLRIKAIDMSCRKKWKQCKTHDSWQKTAQTEFHKSKFRPVRNRPKLRSSKTSQNCHFTPISAWQLFHHSFCISPHSYRRLPSLALPPGLEPLQKPIHWEQVSSLLRRSCERPRQTCTISCHSGRTPKPSSCPANDIRWVYTSEGSPPRPSGDSQWRSVRPQQGHNPWHRTHLWDLPVSNHWSTRTLNGSNRVFS